MSNNRKTILYRF